MHNISAVTNQTVKMLRSLKLKKERLYNGLFLLEGEKLFFEAVQNQVKLAYVMALEGFAQKNKPILEEIENKGIFVAEVSQSVMDAVCEIQTSQGVVCAAELSQIALPEKFPEGFIAVLDGIQDPGNMGTIIRSADAMGAKALLLSKDCADPYSPKCIRSAMGSTFHLPIYICDLEEALSCADQQGFMIIAADLKGNESLPSPLPEKLALIIGNEGHGIRECVTNKANYLYRLAMRGRAESLNAAVCASILMYELTK